MIKGKRDPEPKAVAEADLIWQDWIKLHPELFSPPSEKARKNVLHRIEQVYRSGGWIVDLGGGFSVTNGLLAALGMQVNVFDIFEYDLGWLRASGGYDYSSLMRFLTRAGVHFFEVDVCKCNLRTHFPENSVDAVVSYHCLEHLHQSPREVLESALAVLKPNGLLLVEVPNAINLLKRLKVLVGKTNYSDYGDYYESTNFTGHVREYSVSDLKRLAAYLGLAEFEIYGKNWYGSLFDVLGNGWPGQGADALLTRFPGLCGSLFLRAAKVPTIT